MFEKGPEIRIDTRVERFNFDRLLVAARTFLTLANCNNATIAETMRTVCEEHFHWLQRRLSVALVAVNPRHSDKSYTSGKVIKKR